MGFDSVLQVMPVMPVKKKNYCMRSVHFVSCVLHGLPPHPPKGGL